MYCSKINTEWQKRKADDFFVFITTLSHTHSSLLKVLFLVRASSESPHCLKYIFLVETMGKTPRGFAAPTSGSRVSMSSLESLCLRRMQL